MSEIALDFTEEEVDALLANLDALSTAEKAELADIVETLETRKRVQACQDDLIAFCCHVQPDYKVG